MELLEYGGSVEKNKCYTTLAGITHKKKCRKKYLVQNICYLRDKKQLGANIGEAGGIGEMGDRKGKGGRRKQ